MIAALLLPHSDQAAVQGADATADKPECQTRSCAIRVARKRCSQSRPVSCIRRAALHFRIAFTYMKALAWCESKFDPLAVGGPHLGLYQFKPGTWASTPYAGRSVFSAKWNSLGAGWMHRTGRAEEWGRCN